jgi:hypothetical protein
VVALLALLAACAPDAGEPPAEDTQLVDVEGTIIEFMASGGGEDTQYLLDVAGQGYLSIAIDGRPPRDIRGVVVEVPADVEVPDDVAGEYAALNALVEETGNPLPVVDYLR